MTSSSDALPAAAGQPAAAAPRDPRRLIAVVGLALTLGYAVLIAGAVLAGDWLLDRDGAPIVNDFAATWAAGRLALAGTPALAWDAEAAKQVVVTAIGRDFPDHYPLFYPPPLLLVAAPFALLPLVPAMLAWLAVTAPLYVLTIRGILGGAAGVLVACAVPAALWNLTATQNGFLTTALFGGALLALPRRPLLAGCLFGLLTYKPQFGLLIPLALVAGGHWRTIAAAAATAAALAAVSWLAFGTAPWLAFLHGLPVARETFLTLGLGNWWKLQSVFGLVRALGGSETLAFVLHGAVAMAAAAGVVVLWRSRASYGLRAAALVTASLLATPYVYIYDLVLLAVPVAFLLRLGLDEGVLPDEPAALLTAGAFLLAYPFCPVQFGLAATLAVALVIARRALVGADMGADAAQPRRGTAASARASARGLTGFWR
ncbi:DUF2029 domain-containing protein [Rhodoplanes serenus]|uniref:DUF2029 domain-containing protein n=1 Tax=Rhodoplanes serenus TaxID=200615 RepID=A0A9X5ARW3_9BRAD|nr:glycosyltransferase family 87 protein [Rhodoplanes serenus]MTW16636.1 DUF2029 domain-containing protein [Rhodoplanes serenus]